MTNTKVDALMCTFNSKVKKKHKMIRQYVDIINVLFNLSNRELDVLALLIEIDLNWDNMRDKDILDSTSRRYIMKETLMNKSNLSRYITILKDRNAIVQAEYGWKINPYIIPKINDNKIIIHFNLTLEEENKL